MKRDEAGRLVKTEGSASTMAEDDPAASDADV